MGKADIYKGIIRYTFPKKERLCSKKYIEELYKKGSSTFLYPFRIVYLSKRENAPFFPQVLIVVPKRSFKKAVDRNRLKRQIREAYRLHKHEVFFDMEESQIPGFIAIVYVGKEKLSFDILEKKLISVLNRFREI